MLIATYKRNGAAPVNLGASIFPPRQCPTFTRPSPSDPNTCIPYTCGPGTVNDPVSRQCLPEHSGSIITPWPCPDFTRPSPTDPNKCIPYTCEPGFVNNTLLRQCLPKPSTGLPQKCPDFTRPLVADPTKCIPYTCGYGTVNDPATRKCIPAPGWAQALKACQAAVIPGRYGAYTRLANGMCVLPRIPAGGTCPRGWSKIVSGADAGKCVPWEIAANYCEPGRKCCPFPRWGGDPSRKLYTELQPTKLFAEDERCVKWNDRPPSSLKHTPLDPRDPDGSIMDFIMNWNNNALGRKEMVGVRGYNLTYKEAETYAFEQNAPSCQHDNVDVGGGAEGIRGDAGVGRWSYGGMSAAVRGGFSPILRFVNPADKGTETINGQLVERQWGVFYSINPPIIPSTYSWDYKGLKVQWPWFFYKITTHAFSTTIRVDQVYAFDKNTGEQFPEEKNARVLVIAPVNEYMIAKIGVNPFLPGYCHRSGFWDFDEWLFPFVGSLVKGITDIGCLLAPYVLPVVPGAGAGAAVAAKVACGLIQSGGGGGAPSLPSGGGATAVEPTDAEMTVVRATWPEGTITAQTASGTWRVAVPIVDPGFWEPRYVEKKQQTMQPGLGFSGFGAFGASDPNVTVVEEKDIDAGITPFYKKWWFWAAVGGGVAVLGTGTYLIVRRRRST